MLLNYRNPQCYQAVLAWHNAGFLHLDLKPDNVAVDSRGDVVILDAGISRRLHDGSATVHGPLGTRGFMAPELSEGGEHVYQATTACDVYSLGATLQEALAASVRAPRDSRVAKVGS